MAGSRRSAPRRIVWLGAALLVGCSADDPSSAADGSAPQGFELLRVDVVAKHPHDPDASTQGLLFWEGSFFESTGGYGSSTVREVEPSTGAVLRQTELDGGLFGEGLARVGSRLLQLTWREKTALEYERDTLVSTGSFSYEGEGWGLCHDGSRLVMSNGSGTLSFRDPLTFQKVGEVSVTREDGVPVARLNELECVGGQVLANVWGTDTLLRIEPASGAVTAVIDASGLLTAAERRSADTFNGIAYDAESERYFVTGKLWPWVFEVRFVP